MIPDLEQGYNTIYLKAIQLLIQIETTSKFTCKIEGQVSGDQGKDNHNHNKNKFNRGIDEELVRLFGLAQLSLDCGSVRGIT